MNTTLKAVIAAQLLHFPTSHASEVATTPDLLNKRFSGKAHTVAVDERRELSNDEQALTPAERDSVTSLVMQSLSSIDSEVKTFYWKLNFRLYEYAANTLHFNPSKNEAQLDSLRDFGQAFQQTFNGIRLSENSLLHHLTTYGNLSSQVISLPTPQELSDELQGTLSLEDQRYYLETWGSY